MNLELTEKLRFIDSKILSLINVLDRKDKRILKFEYEHKKNDKYADELINLRNVFMSYKGKLECYDDIVSIIRNDSLVELNALPEELYPDECYKLSYIVNDSVNNIILELKLIEEGLLNFEVAL